MPRGLRLPGLGKPVRSVLPPITLPLPMGQALSWVPVQLTSHVPSHVWPSPKYLTLEQLKAMWGASPTPTAPAPGLPAWASASQDLVPTTCLPPVLPSSSSFASVTASPKVGGLCVPGTRGAPCVWVWASAHPALSSRPTPGDCSVPVGSGRQRHRHSACLWSGVCAFLSALSTFAATVFSLFFSSLHALLPSFLPLRSCVFS